MPQQHQQHQQHQQQSPLRASHRATCPDYFEAKRSITTAMKDNEFVWLEAQTMHPGIPVWPARLNGIDYVVHASANSRDVPIFAIEVYEQGFLSRYETDREKINDFAKINEVDRVKLIRAESAIPVSQSVSISDNFINRHSLQHAQRSAAQGTAQSIASGGPRAMI